MAFDEAMVERVREVLADQPGLTGRKMFGSYAFFIDGNMCAGVYKDRLLVRTRPDEYEMMLLRDEVNRFPDDGKVLRNWVTIDEEFTAEDDDLARWIESGVEIARGLPPK